MFVACASLALSGCGRGQERSVLKGLPEQIVDWQLDSALFPLDGKGFGFAIRQRQQPKQHLRRKT
jgi:hypothetical protein